MIRFFLYLFSLLLLVSCTPQGDTEADEAEWAEIEAMANDAVHAPSDGGADPSVSSGAVEDPEFSPFYEMLKKMETVERGGGETLLTGKSLTFDYEQRHIQLRGDVTVEDAEGVLKADMLRGRFSVSNEVEFIEAEGRVSLVSSNRTAQADHAIYNHRSGFIKLEGRASAAVDGNRLSGERIQLWIGADDRRMICEPNALLELTAAEGLEFEGISGGSNTVTEIRSDKTVYNESDRMAELIGNVRVRDPRAAMNCRNVRLFLKDNNEIDWIEALGGVIIQSDETRALAERATYKADEGEFALEGEPMIKQGLHVLTGDRILFWHETKRMLCEPNARALLHIPDDIREKFLKDLDE